MAGRVLPRAAAAVASRRPRYERRSRRYALDFGPAQSSLMSQYVRTQLGGREVRGAATALRLLEGALAPSTYAQYGRLFSDFAEFCADEDLCPLPADPWAVFCYVGHLAELGTWAEGSLQPIFSAINRVHRDLDFQPPAVDNHFLSSARRGLARAQVQLGTRDTRIPIPASAVLAIVADAEQANAPLSTLRASLAVALAAIFAGRQDSCVHLRSEDFGVDEDFIWLRLTEKERKHLALRRIVRLPLAQLSVHGHASALPRVAALARCYLQERKLAGLDAEYLLQLRGEPRPVTPAFGRWLAAALERVHVSAPSGFAYLGHSLRSLGASAMSAIGVERHIIVWLGGWSAGGSTMEKHYLDPTVLPCPAAYALYGWALSRQYSTGDGIFCVATTLPDPRVDQEQ